MTVETSPQRWSRVSIVGLGLIGGSMARALRERLPRLHIVGVDRDDVICTPATRALAHECIPEGDAAAVLQAFSASDLVFLAAPVSGIRHWLGEALSQGTLVTDCGSTKRELLLAAHSSPFAERFVPGHPMAGAGAAPGAGSPDLFVGRPWVLCPEGVDPAAFQAVERLVRCVGARPVLMSAAAHDRAVALTSHVPRLVASALTVLVDRAQAFDAAGPAFERLARGAGGSPEMWADVLGSNADEVARALRLLLAELDACAAELERGSGLERNLETLAEAERARAAFESGKSSGRY